MENHHVFCLIPTSLTTVADIYNTICYSVTKPETRTL